MSYLASIAPLPQSMLLFNIDHFFEIEFFVLALYGLINEGIDNSQMFKKTLMNHLFRSAAQHNEAVIARTLNTILLLGTPKLDLIVWKFQRMADQGDPKKTNNTPLT